MSSRRILLLGSPRIEQDRQLVQIERRKAFGLLAYLAVTAETTPRETLATFFWPDYDQSRALAYLRNTLWTLNKALGDDWAMIEGEVVQFNAAAGIEVDIDVFKALIGSIPAGDKPQADSYGASVEPLEQAAALYRGDFMAGFTLKDSPTFDEWQYFQTTHFRERLAAVLNRLVGCYIVRRDYEAAIPHARRLVTLESLDESAHRQLMQLYAWSGQQAAAIRQYREVERILSNELGAAPEAETIRLYEDIQARRITSPERVMEAAGVSASNDGLPAAPANPPSQTAPPASPFIPPPSALPVQTTPFIGRAEELTEIERLLNDPACRLLTLIGPGGIGKTRLAIEVAYRAGNRDGAYFVPLAGVCYPEFVAPTIAAALGVVAPSQENDKTHLLQHLRDKQLLLVIDNMEHLLDSVEVISEILANAPGVKIVTTSRERLNLREEWLFETQGLPYPNGSGLDQLEDYSSVALFIESARRVRADFNLTDADAQAIAQICRLVRGMPLAIELAATWVQMLSPQEIAGEIQNGLDFLATTVRNVPERHRSLRAVFEYSWEQLPSELQGVLSSLALFPGGFRQDAAQVVAGASLHQLLTLVSKSLLRRNPFGRYEMHELLRQYAEEHLSAHQWDGTRDRHCEYFAEFLHHRVARLHTPDQPAALDEIEWEIDNIRVAWLQAVSQRKIEALAKSLDALMDFYQVRNRYQEGAEMFQKAVDALTGDSDAERLLLGRVLAFLAWMQVRQGDVSHLVEQSKQLVRQFPGHPDTPLTLVYLVLLKNPPGTRDTEAEQLARDALAIYEAQNDRWGVALGLWVLGDVVHRHVRYAEAREYLEESMRRFDEIGQPEGMAIVRGMLSESAFTVGDYAGARRYMTESLPLLEAIGDRMHAMEVRGALEHSYRMGGRYNPNYGQVVPTLLDSLNYYEELGDRRRIAWTIYHLGWISYWGGQYEQSIAYSERVLPLFEAINNLEGRSWTHIMRGSAELGLKNYDGALRYAQLGIDVLEGAEFPWSVSGARFVMGDIALESGNYDEARRIFREAITIAHEVQSIMQTLRHLNGYASLLLVEEEPQNATTLAAFVRGHPASGDDGIARAEKILTETRRLLSKKDFEAAVERAKTLTLDDVVKMAVEG